MIGWLIGIGGAMLALGALGAYELAYVGGLPIGWIRVRRVGGLLMEVHLADQWEKMRRAAAAEGIKLVANSGFRRMGEQVRLFAESLLPGATFLAAKPGFSNHQSGTAIDIDTGGGVGSKTHNWLLANSERFGFRNTGLKFSKPEPWHFDFYPALIQV